VVDKVALGQVFSEYFGFPCQFLFHRLLIIHLRLSFGTGTIGQLVADVPSGLTLTSPPPKKKTRANVRNNRNDFVKNCLKAGIEKSFPRQRILTIASVARQRLGEPLIATTIVVERQRKNPSVRVGVS
jgi:hypothetical protein